MSAKHDHFAATYYLLLTKRREVQFSQVKQGDGSASSNNPSKTGRATPPTHSNTSSGRPNTSHYTQHPPRESNVSKQRNDWTSAPNKVVGVDLPEGAIRNTVIPPLVTKAKSNNEDASYTSRQPNPPPHPKPHPPPHPPTKPPSTAPSNRSRSAATHGRNGVRSTTKPSYHNNYESNTNTNDLHGEPDHGVESSNSSSGKENASPNNANGQFVPHPSPGPPSSNHTVPHRPNPPSNPNVPSARFRSNRYTPAAHRHANATTPATTDGVEEDQQPVSVPKRPATVYTDMKSNAIASTSPTNGSHAQNDQIKPKSLAFEARPTLPETAIQAPHTSRPAYWRRDRDSATDNVPVSEKEQSDQLATTSIPSGSQTARVPDKDQRNIPHTPPPLSVNTMTPTSRPSPSARDTSPYSKPTTTPFSNGKPSIRTTFNVSQVMQHAFCVHIYCHWLHCIHLLISHSLSMRRPLRSVR